MVYKGERRFPSLISNPDTSPSVNPLTHMGSFPARSLLSLQQERWYTNPPRTLNDGMSFYLEVLWDRSSRELILDILQLLSSISLETERYNG